VSQNRYYVTLGLQYKHEPHPVLPRERSNPGGFLIVRADSEREAREMVQNVIGLAYANLYTEADFQRGHHPLGCLGEILHGVYDAPGQAAARVLAEADDDVLRLAVESLSPTERMALRRLLTGSES
jgi:hypothetical protein